METIAGEPRSFGVEEEYLLLDSAHGTPVDSAAELGLAMRRTEGDLEREFFASQVETATPICRTGEEADASLLGFRRAVARSGAERGIVLAGTGLPPMGGDEPGTVTPKPRYRVIEAEMRAAGHHQYGTGTHVHVGVPNRTAGIEALAHLARWAPAFLALTANSPLWCGTPTGFASWRHILGRSWPVSGYPHEFEDAQGYADAVARLVNTGVVPDPGVVTWSARLSERYPTIELRIADAQLTAESAVSFALLVRASVERGLRDAEAGAERPRYAPGLVDGANWLAARDGLASELVDPLAGEPLLAFALVDRMLDHVDRMLDHVDRELDGFGDRERIAGWVDELREQGGPARRQLAAFSAGGIAGLLELYRGGPASLAVEPDAVVR